MLRALFFDLNSFFASCEQQMQPSLRGLPTIVVPTKIGEADATCAIAASYEAKRFGIRTGTPVAAAKQYCPGLRVVEARPRIYSQFHERIMSELEEEMGTIYKVSIDEAWMRLDASCNDPVRAEALGRHLKRRVQARVGDCLTSSVGIAPNRYLAKIASNMQKPDGLVVLREEDLPGRLLELPVGALHGVGPRMRQRLYACGIYTMEQLWATPPGHLRRIWGGVEGARFWYRLHGMDAPGFETLQKSVIGHSRVLEPSLRDFEGAREVTRQLLLKAAVRLRRSRYRTRALELSIHLTGPYGGGGRKLYGSQTLPPVCDSLTLTRALDGMWRGCAGRAGPNELPKKVGITLHDLVPDGQSTPDLLGDWLGADPRQGWTAALGVAAPGVAAPGVAAPHEKIARQERLCAELDRMNHRWGGGTVQMGMPYQWNGAPKPGTKIAFTRIPDPVEYWE